MRLTTNLGRGLAAAAIAFAAQALANADPKVLAQVGRLQVTAEDLQRAEASSPFATQMPSMDPGDQAALRNQLLHRLVAQRLLLQEARAQGLARDPAYMRDREAFRLGLLYRKYMAELRARIQIPADVRKAVREQYPEDADAREAALASYRVDRFRTIKALTLKTLKDRYHLVFHPGRIAGATADTVLAEGDKGLRITLADILGSRSRKEVTDAWIEDRLYQRAELLLAARAAEDEGADLSREMADYDRERLPAFLAERKEAEWVPNDQILKDYLQAHPEFARLPERWHLGQIVVRTRGEAEALRKRILAGESLFRLAGKYSIDPYGREHLGDMGWVREGSGYPALAKALAGLPDNPVSEVVKTPMGYHLALILERRPGETLPFVAVRERLRQAVINERMAAYVNGLTDKYRVAWRVAVPGEGR